MTMTLEELLEIESTCRDDATVDLRALEYVSSYDAHLMCPICHCAFVRPVRLQCDHIFCQRCLSFAVTSCSERDEFNCPTCRTPTNDVYTDVPRLLMNMCDDIRVRCPYSSEGCPKVVPRGHVELHVEKYCGYKLVECPSETCNQETRKKDVIEDKCRHERRQCLGCEEDIMDQDYEEHTNRLCPSLEALCPDCDEIIPLRDLEHHISICPEAIQSCKAAKYGCQARVKRANVTAHEQQCPLVAMSPCFEAQNARIDSLELTIRHLQQRNEIFEDGISNIRSTLVDSSSSPRSRNRSATASASVSGSGPASGPDETNPNAINYLLSVHESLRTEVGQLSHAITDLDARASMSIMNESLRIKEDMAHTNAALNSIRMQVQWLINPRLHQHQVQRTSNDGNGTGTGTGTRTGSGSESATASNSAAVASGLRPRRLSDSAREGTKL